MWKVLHVIPRHLTSLNAWYKTYKVLCVNIEVLEGGKYACKFLNVINHVFFPSKLRLICIFDKFNSVFMEYLLLAFSDCTKHNSEDTDMHVMLMHWRISLPSTTIPVFLRIKAFKLYCF